MVKTSSISPLTITGKLTTLDGFLFSLSTSFIMTSFKISILVKSTLYNPYTSELFKTSLIKLPKFFFIIVFSFLFILHIIKIPIEAHMNTVTVTTIIFLILFIK